MPFLRPKSVFTVAPEVEGFRSVMVNYYFVRVSPSLREWVLVDAGLSRSGPRLLREAERRFGRGNPPLAVILTHGHFDHVGALPWLLQHWSVIVYAHLNELPFLNEHSRYPAPDPRVGGGLMALGSPLYPRSVARLPTRVEPLPEDGRVPELPGWQWIATPGHTPGHVSFWRERDRLLLSGDALITTRQESALSVLKQKVELRPPPAYFTPDWQRAYRSILRLQTLAPSQVASGHGLPVGGQILRDSLELLVRDFASSGLPRHGRYVPGTWGTA